jgi:broad specificity phosphatase PhoE
MPSPVIYYIRHGLTDWNVQQRLQGRHDVPLNPQGHAQAVRCGEILCDLLMRAGRAPRELDYVSSPLIRARKTMEIMRATLGLEPGRYRVDVRLAEIGFGEWEGLTYADVVARDQDVVARRESNKWSCASGTRPSPGTPSSPPTAAPRARSLRISATHPRRRLRIFPSIRVWSMYSGLTGSRAMRDRCRRSVISNRSSEWRRDRF